MTEAGTIEDINLESLIAPFEEEGIPKDHRTHIVNPPKNGHIWQEGMSTKEMVYLARMSGIELVALCGYRWIPKYNPENFPVCEECMTIGMDMVRE